MFWYIVAFAGGYAACWFTKDIALSVVAGAKKLVG